MPIARRRGTSGEDLSRLVDLDYLSRSKISITVKAYP
jgi:hypothetical protein